MVKIIFFNVVAYLIGSISSAILICRLKGLPDPRTHGSKNPGATNVLRIGDKFSAICVILADTLKGFIPVIIAKALGTQGFELSTIGASAVLGHIFPIFFKFKGGKGIATTFGMLLALSWLLAAVVALGWGITAFLFRYASLAGIVAAIFAPLSSYFLTQPSYVPMISFLSLLILLRHRQNIKRLLARTEPSFCR